MRRETLLVQGRPSGQDSEIPVDLHRVGVDDRRAEPLGEHKRRRRLAARRRACDEKRPPQVLARSSGSVMSSVLVATLIADPAKEPLIEAILDRAAQALNGVERRRWLDEGVAADLVFTGNLKAKRAAVEESLSGESVDVIVQPL